TAGGGGMQNKYVGDIGDFAKYGLLRHLAATAPLRLGVTWYLTPDEGHSGDGGHTRYLLPGNEHLYIDCDEALYRELRGLVMSGRRSVAAVRAHGILPAGTVYYENLLGAFGVGSRRSEAVREEWHQQALVATSPCDLVFLDPDNGVPLGVASPGIKHARFQEI